MRVAAYVRVSTEEQATKGNSIEEQKERITYEARQNDWDKPEFFIDDGYSGKDMRRPELSRLLQAVENGEIHLVVTTKLDRLSRRLYDTLKIVEQMQRHNCKYVCLNLSMDLNTPQGMLMLQNMGSFAEFEREMIRERVRDNLISIAKKSGVTKKAFTTPCYGYNLEDGRFVINEEEMRVVRMIGEWILNGDGPKLIASRLNSPVYNVRTKQGGYWHDNTIRNLMRRETLYGAFIYNRTYKRNGTGKQLTRPKEEWIVVEDHHPAIFDKDEWDEIQIALSSRKRSMKQTSNERWLLSGLLICGHCGGKMAGYARHKKLESNGQMKDYFRYKCQTYTSQGLCFHHWIDRDDIEELVIHRLKEISESMQPHLLQIAVSTSKSEDDEMRDLTIRLERLDQKMQRQLEAFEDDLISAEDLKRARQRIDEERSKIVAELERIKNGDSRGSTDRVASHIRKRDSQLQSDDRLIQKNAIRQLIHSITIYNGEEVEIMFNIR